MYDCSAALVENKREQIIQYDDSAKTKLLSPIHELKMSKVCRIASCQIMSQGSCLPAPPSAISLLPAPNCSLEAIQNDPQGYKQTFCIEYKLSLASNSKSVTVLKDDVVVEQRPINCETAVKPMQVRDYVAEYDETIKVKQLIKNYEDLFFHNQKDKCIL